MRRINYYSTFVWMYRSKFFYPSLLVLLWVVMIYIADPIGNFPLNDDWQYARPVWYLINKGYYFSPDTYSPIIISQVFWGALFCLPGGFSFNTLRISTLVLSLAGVLVFYFLLLKSSKNQKLSFLGALLLAANPLYVDASNTFMTEVPFLTFSIISVYFFFCSIESNKRIHIIVATLFAIIASLIRQFGVIIPIAFAFVSMIKNRPKFIQWGKYFLPAIVTGIFLASGILWLKYIGSELKPYDGRTMIDFIKKPGDIFTNLLKRSSLVILYSGFFLLPLLLCTLRYSISQITKRGKVIISVIILLFIPLLLIWCTELPFKNVFNTYGIGPRTLKGMRETITHSNPDFPPILLYLLQALAFLGAILLLINLGKIIMDIIRGYVNRSFTKFLYLQAFILLLISGYALLLSIPDFLFDRYFLPFIPLFAILIIAGINEIIRIRLPMHAAYCFIALAMGLLSAAMTHDYFAWNRSRWQATDYLTKDLKISPHKIDGGYEFNGWLIGTNFPDNPKNPNRSWWSVDDDEYVVAFHNFDGYTIIKQYSYQNYVPYEMKNIYILHRK